jgi:hypothetical protein
VEDRPFAVNFDLINNKNLTFIKLGACTANVLSAVSKILHS